MSAEPVPNPRSAPDLAVEALNAVLRAQYLGAPLTIVDSGPGAGKTELVELVAAQEAAILLGRALIVTQTNEQACDVAARFASRFPSVPCALRVRETLEVPATVTAAPQLVLARDWRSLPSGPGVFIANAALWSFLDPHDAEPFSVQIIDEAYQLPDFRFHQIAQLGVRKVLVGDPGQILPILPKELERWKCEPAGPHVPCPQAMRVRFPQIRPVNLPITRRLPLDTVAVVQPAFYPSLPFVATAGAGARRLQAADGGTSLEDRAIDRALAGESIVHLTLPPFAIGEVDVLAAETIVRLLNALFARSASTLDDGRVIALTPRQVGVVCAHQAQATEVLSRLNGAAVDVLVETADSFQGLERAVMIVHHPLSGRSAADNFHADAGRLCVMMSRHRVS